MPLCQMQKRRTCHKPACRGPPSLPERPDVEIRPMADDEIDVDGYVMEPELRGTRSRSACVTLRAMAG